jgi:sporulation protein YqfC
MEENEPMDNTVDMIKKGIADLLELPRDIALDLPKISMVGNMQLYMENHKGIIEYSTDTVRINAKGGIVLVTGNRLVIKNIALEEIILTGEIEKLEFLR